VGTSVPEPIKLYSAPAPEEKELLGSGSENKNSSAPDPTPFIFHRIFITIFLRPAQIKNGLHVNFTF
jgi:hypothetical protein